MRENEIHIRKGEEGKVDKEIAERERESKTGKSKKRSGMERKGELRRGVRKERDSSASLICLGDIHQSDSA